MSTTTLDKPKISAAQQAILDTRKPCPVEPVSRVVMIHLYDPERQIDDKPWMNTGALDDLKAFYNGLKDRADTSADSKAVLNNYTFDARYYPGGPTDDERGKLGRMDFPFYIAVDKSGGELVALMELHQISPVPKVQKIDKDNPAQSYYKPVEGRYGDIEASWRNELILGYGMPGEYFVQLESSPLPGLGNCRKLGIIKLEALLKWIASHDLQRSKLARAMRHEMGHMLGMAHFDGTVMAEDYDDITDSFNTSQVRTISGTLKKLSPL